jgi:hypothetical protein
MIYKHHLLIRPDFLIIKPGAFSHLLWRSMKKAEVSAVEVLGIWHSHYPFVQNTSTPSYVHTAKP